MWKVLRSLTKKIHRFTITVDEVGLANKDMFTFSYINFAKGVCILPITNDGQVLIIRQYRHAVKSWQWELPAGAIENGEDPFETAKRELKEETGCLAHDWIPLGSFHPSPGSTSEEIFLYAARQLEKGQQQLENSEQIELHELSKERLRELISSGKFQHGAGMAAILRYAVLEGKI